MLMNQFVPLSRTGIASVTAASVELSAMLVYKILVLYRNSSTRDTASKTLLAILRRVDHTFGGSTI